MEELAAEIRTLSTRVKSLTYVVGFVTVVLIGMIVGLQEGASKAGPRLVEMRKRSDALLEENNRLRAELEAARRAGSH